MEIISYLLLDAFVDWSNLGVNWAQTLLTQSLVYLTPCLPCWCKLSLTCCSPDGATRCRPQCKTLRQTGPETEKVIFFMLPNPAFHVAISRYHAKIGSQGNHQTALTHNCRLPNCGWSRHTHTHFNDVFKLTHGLTVPFISVKYTPPPSL